jgi:competence protein ComEC
MVQDHTLQQFHLHPCRLLHRVINPFTPGISPDEKNFFRFGKTSLLLIDRPVNSNVKTKSTPVDIIVLLKNPPIKIAELSVVFPCRQFVFDASNPSWKVAKWQRECDSLGLSAFSVADKGAFVFNLY